MAARSERWSAWGWGLLAVLALVGVPVAVVKLVGGTGLLPFHLEKGIVRESIADVRAAIAKALGRSVSNVSEGVAVLATMIASEAGTLPRAGQVGVAWAALNAATNGRAAQLGRAEREAALVAKVVPKRVLGEQGTASGYAATSKPPTKTTVGVAEDVLALRVADPTRGAKQWDSPASQRVLHARDPKKYKTPEQVAAARLAAGKRQVLVAGVPADKTRFWA